MRDGYDAALDEARALRDQSRLVVAAMQASYAEETGVKALKIRHNNVLGYFIEVTAQHGEKLLAAPLNARFIHRQTLAGQVRFATTELGEIEARIANAGERALGARTGDLRAACRRGDRCRRRPARRGACLRHARCRNRAGAARGGRQHYVRPEVDASLAFTIEGGRHPVVEQALKRDGQPFIANTAICRRRPASRTARSG